MDTRTQIKPSMDIAWRREWWVIAPALLGLVVSLHLAMTLPRRCGKFAMAPVLRHGVPANLVRSTATMRIEERMKSLRNQVMSRRDVANVVKGAELAPANASVATLERERAPLTHGTLPGAVLNGLAFTPVDRHHDRYDDHSSRRCVGRHGANDGDDNGGSSS